MANGGLVRGIAGPCPPRIQKHGMATQRRVTEILISLRDGDRQAFDELVPLVYNELKRIPRSKLRLERSGHTLSTTALINEAPPSTAPLPRWPPRSGTPAFPMTRSSRRRSGYKWQQTWLQPRRPKRKDRSGSRCPGCVSCPAEGCRRGRTGRSRKPLSA